MIRRPRRTVPAMIVALVLLAAAVVVTWACVQVLLGRTPIISFTALAALGAALTWDSLPVLITGGVLVVLGLILLVAAARPGRPTVIALAERPATPTVTADMIAAARSWDDLDRTTGAASQPAAQPDTGASRSSIATALTAAAADVDGVERATVSVSGRAVTATVHTPLRADPALTDHVRDALAAKLDDIGLARPPRVRVRTATSSAGSS